MSIGKERPFGPTLPNREFGFHSEFWERRGRRQSLPRAKVAPFQASTPTVHELARSKHSPQISRMVRRVATYCPYIPSMSVDPPTI